MKDIDLIIGELSHNRAIETGETLEDAYDYYIDLEIVDLLEQYELLRKGKI